jgi:hypothetical protein
VTSARHHPAPELVLPQGAVIDRVALDRLHEQLASRDDVAAVIAPFVTPPPGASFRAVAQRAVLLPASAAYVTSDPPPGAALLRPDVPYEVVGDRVQLSEGIVLVDPGSTSHDPAAEVVPGPASPDGRSAFPRAPLVVFVGLEHESGRAIWARDLVNRLFDHDVEGRLATTPHAPAPHLSVPCPADRATLRTLQPDIVVTLDDTALATAPEWCDRRSTVIVHHTGERTLTTELVSWRIGATFGRVRAYIGSAVQPDEFAALCSRLCAGPFPAPPRRDGDVTATPAIVRRKVRTSRRVIVVPGPSALDERLQHFVDEARAQGADATVAARDDESSDVLDADVVLLAGDVDPAHGAALVDMRAERGRRTVVDVSDVAVADPPFVLAERAGRATTATRSLADLARARGVRACVLPRTLTRANAIEIDRRRARSTALSERTRLGVVHSRPDASIRTAVESAVLALLDDHRDLLVDLVDDGGDPLARLRAHDRVASLPTYGPDDVVAWRAQLWVGVPTISADGFDQRPLLEAGLAGVPMVFAADMRGEIDDEVLCRGAVDEITDADAWLAALRRAVAIEETSDLTLRTELLGGPKAGTAIVNRILGWADSTSGAR